MRAILAPQTPVEIWTICTVSIGVFIVLIGIGIAGIAIHEFWKSRNRTDLTHTLINAAGFILLPVALWLALAR